MQMKLYYVIVMRKDWGYDSLYPVYRAGPFGCYADAVDKMQELDAEYSPVHEIAETVVEVQW